MLTPKETGRAGGFAYPVPIGYSVLCEAGFTSAGTVADNATVALGVKLTNVDTGYPLCDPTHHYLLTIRKTGDAVTVFRQGGELGSHTTSAATYAEIVAESLTLYAGAHAGYFSRLVVVEELLEPSAFYRRPTTVPGLWVPGPLGSLVPHTLLEFADGSDLGHDSSGNGNHWVFADGAQSLDTPTHNGCTLHPLDPDTAGTLSGGNLTTTGEARVTLRPESGKWYYEQDGTGVSYDADANGPFNPLLAAGTYNFGGAAWVDSGPATDESPLMDAWLPEPSVLDPGEHYLVTTFAAPAGTSQSVEAGFDLEENGWLGILKSTSGEAGLLFTPAVGLDRCLDLTATAAAQSLTTPVEVSGRTLTLPDELLTDGSTYRLTLLRRGADTGVDILTYTGTLATLDVSHGLGAVPGGFFVKNLDGADGWVWYTEGMGPSAFMYGNSSAGSSTNGNVFDGTAPTGAAITLGPSPATNGSGEAFLAVVFGASEVLEFLCWDGNGLADGPVVCTGGRPVAVDFLKRRGTGSWNVLDTERTGLNPLGAYWWANVSNAEASGDLIAVLSDGFKAVSADAEVNAASDYSALILKTQTKYRNAF